jgi:hypothetical protein
MGNFDLGNASPEIVKEVKRDVASLERALRGGPVDSRTGITLNMNRTDLGAMREELHSKKRWLEKYEAEPLKGDAANKALKRANELKERIKAKMQPKNKFYQFYATNQRKEKDFQEAVSWEAKLLRDKEYKQEVQEYRALMRQIDPSDPTVFNIERLREGKNVRIRR